VNWAWLNRNAGQITSWFLDHLVLAGVPTVLGLVLAIPIGAVARRYRFVYPPLVTLAGLLYTIPSIALFVLLPGIIGTKVLDPINVVVALTLYTLALLIRTVADSLASVAPDVIQSATAMGFRPVRRLLSVELPVALPVIGAGVRVAAVSNVSLVAVAALIGVPQLGALFTKGFELDFYTPIFAGIVGCVVIAVVFDVIIVSVVRWRTPWRQAAGR
jgi:osmoprotectant transport system permease protein